MLVRYLEQMLSLLQVLNLNKLSAQLAQDAVPTNLDTSKTPTLIYVNLSVCVLIHTLLSRAKIKLGTYGTANLNG